MVQLGYGVGSKGQRSTESLHSLGSPLLSTATSQVATLPPLDTLQGREMEVVDMETTLANTSAGAGTF